MMHMAVKFCSWKVVQYFARRGTCFFQAGADMDFHKKVAIAMKCQLRTRKSQSFKTFDIEKNNIWFTKFFN